MQRHKFDLLLFSSIRKIAFAIKLTAMKKYHSLPKISWYRPFCLGAQLLLILCTGLVSGCASSNGSPTQTESVLQPAKSNNQDRDFDTFNVEAVVSYDVSLKASAEKEIPATLRFYADRQVLTFTYIYYCGSGEEFDRAGSKVTITIPNESDLLTFEALDISVCAGQELSDQPRSVQMPFSILDDGTIRAHETDANGKVTVEDALVAVPW